MPVISRLLSIPLRIAEIAFAAVVVGIIGHYLASFDSIEPWPQARWIYTEVIGGLSILLALIWLIPFSSGFFSWPRMFFSAVDVTRIYTFTNWLDS